MTVGGSGSIYKYLKATDWPMKTTFTSLHVLVVMVFPYAASFIPVNCTGCLIAILAKGFWRYLKNTENTQNKYSTAIFSNLFAFLMLMCCAPWRWIVPFSFCKCMEHPVEYEKSIHPTLTDALMNIESRQKLQFFPFKNYSGRTWFINRKCVTLINASQASKRNPW